MPQAIAEDTVFLDSPAIALRSHDGGSATVLLHGAHIVSWVPATSDERLYLSEKTAVVPGKAIRGGVPVIFPQFAGRGPLPKHGFARNMVWQKVAAKTGEDYALATLRLTDSEETRALWPHAFCAELTVSVTGNRIDIELDVENRGEDSLEFTTALHTYLRTREVEQTTLEGLNGRHYEDCVKKESRVDTGTALCVEDEMDRIYHKVDRPLLMREPHRALGIYHHNMPDVVVWNPWEKCAQQFTDMPANGFRRMLCVEAAVIERPVSLAPGQSWWGRQTLVAM